MTRYDLALLLLAFTTLGCSSRNAAVVMPASVVIAAEHAPPTRQGGTIGGTFNTGVGIAGDSGTTYDNREAQPFRVTHAGKLRDIEITLSRIDGTTAPLLMEVTSFANGQPGEVLATSSIDANGIAFGASLGNETMNSRFVFDDGPVLASDQTYAFVLRSAEPPANYRVYGNYIERDAESDDLTLLSKQNQRPWEAAESRLFYRVTVESARSANGKLQAD